VQEASTVPAHTLTINPRAARANPHKPEPHWLVREQIMQIPSFQTPALILEQLYEIEPTNPPQVPTKT
jgi:hypothetical protein